MNISISWPSKRSLPLEARLLLQALAGGERGARGLPQAILIVAVERGLAVVANAEAVVGVVHAVIGLMPDQNHAGAARHVPVIGDVEQQLVEDAALNPAWKIGISGSRSTLAGS